MKKKNTKKIQETDQKAAKPSASADEKNISEDKNAAGNKTEEKKPSEKAAPDKEVSEAKVPVTEEENKSVKEHSRAFVYAGKFFRGLCFFLILALMMPIFTYMFHPKNNTKASGMKDQNAHGFYAEPANTIDTVIIGNSEAYSSFSPLEMWHSHGMTTYVSAQGAILMSEAYYILKEILKTQSPSLVIFETDALFPPKSDATLRDRTLNNVMENEMPLFKYHDNWKIFNPKDYFAPIEYKWQSFSRGQMVDPSTVPLETPELRLEDGKDEEYKNGVISPYIMYYLNKFVDLCHENGIDVMLVTIPNTLTSSKENHEAVRKYAESRNIPHIDFGTHPEYVNIDWTLDTRDGGVHMNTFGAKKISDYLGKYIKEHYKIPDRRNDKKLAERWNKDYKKYQNYIKAKLKELNETDAA